MTGLLIFLLFVLNAILAFAIVLLFQRQNRLLEMEKKESQIQKESEALLTAFLIELKEENEQFISKINNLRREMSIHASGNEINGDVNREYEVYTDEVNQLNTKGYSRMQAVQAYKVNTQEETLPENSNEETLEQIEDKKEYSEAVYELYKQGMTIDQIAKKMKKGKTEVELLLKFHDDLN